LCAALPRAGGDAGHAAVSIVEGSASDDRVGLPERGVTLPTTRTVLIGLAAVVAVGLLGAGGWYWYATTQHRAMATYAEALARAQPALGPEATIDARAAAIRDLEAALTQYPSGRGAAQVAYQLGNLRYQTQQYPQARGAYELAVAQGATRTLRVLSQGGVAYTWEAEHNYSKAIEAFKVALTGLGPKDFYYEELLLGLGRVQELGGQKADATATYRRALSELTQSRRLEEIRARLTALGA